MKVCFQCTCISSAMFITAMAANPLAVNLAAQSIGVNITWGQWALGGLVPGLICLLGIPLILYVLYPPEIKNTPDAPALAKAELAKLGPLSRDEKITAAALGATVVMWIAGASLGINSVGAALAGLSVLLVTNVITWKECLSMNESWDTLTWFAALIGMASALNKYGLITWFSQEVTVIVGNMGLSWQAAYFAVMLLYFYSHYLFASSTAHIGAMFTAMLSVCMACGAPGMLSALSLCYLSNIMGCLTNYGIGSAPSYFGSKYVPQGPWYMYGAILSVFYLAVWLGIGPIWWKVVGLI
jgi:anion transporter